MRQAVSASVPAIPQVDVSGSEQDLFILYAAGYI